MSENHETKPMNSKRATFGSEEREPESPWCLQLDGFPDIAEEFKQIDEQDDDLLVKIQSYRRAISSFEDEMLRCRGDSAEETLRAVVVRTKLALAQLALSRQIRSLPASMSEHRAIFDEDPEIISKRAFRNVEKSEAVLLSWLALAKEIQGHSLAMANDAGPAHQAFQESLLYKDQTKLRDLVENTMRSPEERGEETEAMQEEKESQSSGRKRNKGSGTRAEPTRDEDMDCLICLKLLYDPVTTPCGHTFCRPCFQRTLDTNSRCPLCRRVFYSGFDLPVNISLKNILERCFPEEYALRKEEEQFIPVQESSGVRGQLPLFVLSPMMPGESMTLNVFEPRYRLMIRRVMEGNKRFGMVAMAGNNTLASVGCEVEIVEIEAIPDGRYVIEVRGVQRFEVDSQHGVDQVDGYRVAVDPTFFSDDLVPDEEIEYVRKLVDEVDELVSRWVDKLSEMTESQRAPSLLLQTAGAHPGKQHLEKFSFWAATSILAFIQGRERKQRLIESRSTSERLGEAKELLLAAEALSNRGPGGQCSLM